jgi:PAS domain S-box-containing protein
MASPTALRNYNPLPDEFRFLRSLLAASDDCIKILDLDGNLIFMSDSGQRAIEVSDFESIRGSSWPTFWQGEMVKVAQAAIETARSGGTARFQGGMETLSGARRYWDVHVRPIPGDDGTATHLLAVARDITALKAAEDEHQPLKLELKHRVKNTLAMVQAIARQTMTGRRPQIEANENFFQRLRSLADAHDALYHGRWSETPIRTLADNVARLHDHGDAKRFRIAGPDLMLGPRAAVAFALVLHELGTNAVKYGALSRPDGHVSASWAVVTHGAEPLLRFDWQEVGGPLVTAPVEPGFGTQLIEQSLSSDFGAAVHLAYLPDGFAFNLEVALSSLQRML